MPEPDPVPIQLLCLDVDGVLTDGGILIDDLGVETKRYHVRDGAGMRLWMKLGYDIAIITGRRGMSVRHRMRELGVTNIIQGAANKGAALDELLEELGLAAAQVAMLGDDLPDLPALRRVGYPMAVADACREVRDMAVFTTVRPGGAGAVREVVEHLLKARDEWGAAVDVFDPE